MMLLQNRGIMKQLGILVIIAVLLLGIASVSSAQTAPKSVGCQQWNISVGGGLVGSGIPSGTTSIPINVPVADYIAGEVLQLRWGASEDNTLTVTSLLVNAVVNNPANTLANYTIIIPSDGSYQFDLMIDFSYPAGSGYFYSYARSCTPAPTPISNSQSSSLETVIGGCDFMDGRVNFRDCDAPIVIYQYDTMVDLYAIDPSTSAGLSILQIAIADINPVEQNTLLGETTHPDTGEVIQLWLFASGELQLQTVLSDDKPYIIIWSVDDPQDYIRRIE